MATQRITRKRGDTYPIPITIKQNGSAIDITGYSLVLSVSSSAEPTTANYIFQSTGAVAADQVTNKGKATFPITTEQADNLGNYYYDVQITDDSGYIHTPLGGVFEIVQDITK